jgi:membrane protease YdiL (CAAX protease family)
MSAIPVGVLFAAVHPQGWTFIPVLGTIGFILAGIREWRGGIVASMTAHALSNFVVVTIGVNVLGK